MIPIIFLVWSFNDRFSKSNTVILYRFLEDYDSVNRNEKLIFILLTFCVFLYFLSIFSQKILYYFRCLNHKLISAYFHCGYLLIDQKTFTVFVNCIEYNHNLLFEAKLKTKTLMKRHAIDSYHISNL